MTAKDKNIWESYTRGVKPVRAGKISTPKITEKTRVPKKRDDISLAAPTPAAFTSSPADFSATSLERRRERGLRQGKIEIDAKLDLHGMTQDEAYDALAHFMHKQSKAGKRHLLIVTGKGRGGEGILRRNLKNWLGHLPEAEYILAVRQAAPQHGGDGAFYVVLRKPKDARHS